MCEKIANWGIKKVIVFFKFNTKLNIFRFFKMRNEISKKVIIKIIFKFITFAILSSTKNNNNYYRLASSSSVPKIEQNIEPSTYLLVCLFDSVWSIVSILSKLLLFLDYSSLVFSLKSPDTIHLTFDRSVPSFFQNPNPLSFLFFFNSNAKTGTGRSIEKGLEKGWVDSSEVQWCISKMQVSSLPCLYSTLSAVCFFLVFLN